tara:strand:+ start:321 stop:473 length:153 start_codon:yes stop_codon:yes gene_type:complete
MSTFKFTTKAGSPILACEASNADKAWEWIKTVKQLTLLQAKNLYNITKIN